MLRSLALVSFALALAAIPAAPAATAQQDLHADLDRILDTYVRDGRVYYRALEIERAALDRYLGTLGSVAPDALERMSPPAREAFWLNAYNALVLRTVIDAYPIRGRSSDYPRDSIRQIPGAFDTAAHRIAGQRVTLDWIEAHMLAEFGDARVVLAVGRGANGGGRLRSEAYRAERLDAQLDEAVEECAHRVACVSIDRLAGTVTVTPLVGWHRQAFEHTFLPAAGDRWLSRSPIERAVAAMAFPYLFPREQDVLTANTFRLEYGTFDWSLNEL